MTEIINNPTNVLSEVILFVIAAIVIYLLASYVSIRVAHKLELEWWNHPELSSKSAIKKYGGANYDDRFSMMSMFAAKQNQLTYFVINLFQPPIAHLEMTHYRFLIDRIFLYRLYRDGNNVQQGIVTPKAMCESVLLKPGDGDDRFDAWFSTAQYVEGSYRYNFDADAPALFVSVPLDDKYKMGGTKQCWTFRRKLSGSHVGLYPSADDLGGWQGQFLFWLNTQPDGNVFRIQQGCWVFYTDDSLEGGKAMPGWWEGDGTNSSKKNDNWWNRADNFLGRMGVSYNCPLCIYFLNGEYTQDGVKVDSQSFKQLLGSSSSVAGGWVGLVQANISQDEGWFLNIMDSSVKTHINPKPPCTKPNAGAGFMGFVGSVVPLLLMIPGVGPATAGVSTLARFGPRIAGLLGTGAVGIGAGIQAGSGSCA